MFQGGVGVGNSVFLFFFFFFGGDFFFFGGEFFFVAKVAVLPNEDLAKPWQAINQI